MDAERTRAAGGASASPANPNPTPGYCPPGTKPVAVVGPATVYTGTYTGGAAGTSGSGAAAGDRATGSSNGDGHPAEAFKSAFGLFGEFTDYLSYYVSAKVDGVKATVRNIGVYAGLGVVGLIVGLGVLATTGALLVLGISGAITGLCHALGWWVGPWFGHLITSLLLLGALAGGVFWFMGKITGSSRRATIDKYKAKVGEQRAKYGHDVHERAAEKVD